MDGESGLNIFSARREKVAGARAAVIAELGLPITDVDPLAALIDHAGFWELADGTVISLALEATETAIRITRISCEPQGTGLGSKIVTALLDHAHARGLILEVPDPFPEAMGFWDRFDWDVDDSGAHAALMLRSRRS